MNPSEQDIEDFKKSTARQRRCSVFAYTFAALLGLLVGMCTLGLTACLAGPVIGSAVVLPCAMVAGASASAAAFHFFGNPHRKALLGMDKELKTIKKANELAKSDDVDSFSKGVNC